MLESTTSRKELGGTGTLSNEHQVERKSADEQRHKTSFEKGEELDLENERELVVTNQYVAELPNEDSPREEQDTTGATTDLERSQTIASNRPLYTVFTPRQKLLIVVVSAWGAFISPISTAIYLPALNTLAAEFHVTATQINLTVTTFLIFQGLSPMFIGGFASSAGYRPAFIICFVIYLVANVALACANSYPALLLLRMLQSMGSSGTIALRNGVIASVITPAERGTALGLVQVGTLVGPAFGPAIGGVLAAKVGWRWIFWFLAILTGSALIPQLLFVPETNRKIVGNGSLPPWEWYNLSLFDLKRRKALDKPTYDAKRKALGLPPRAKLGWPNPWPSLVLLAEKDTAIVLACGAVNFAALYDVTTSVPVLYADIYGFDTVQVSLVYIAIGGGAATAAILNGRLLDYNFRRTAKEHGLSVDKKRGQDLRYFPVEKARLRAVFPLLAWGSACLLAYGWVLEKRGPLPVALILAYFGATGFVSCFSSVNNLIIDTHPTSPSTVTATANITRCLLGAAATAVINPMIDGMGVGWCFTLIAGLMFATSPLLFVILKQGPKWREERWVSQDKMKEEKAAKEKKEERERESHEDSTDGKATEVKVGPVNEKVEEAKEEEAQKEKHLPR